QPCERSLRPHPKPWMNRCYSASMMMHDGRPVHTMIPTGLPGLIRARTGVVNVPRLGAGLLAAAQPTWMCAEIEGEALLLGRWQRRGAETAAVRRMAGGRALQISGRAILVLLGLPDWSVLGAPDPARVLNRHVRGIRAALAGGLRRMVAYFGRDHLV